MAVPVASLLSSALKTSAGFAYRASTPYWVRQTVNIFAGDLPTISNLSGLSIRRLEGILSGKVNIGSSQINKLRSVYGEYSYNMLRSAGASTSFATKYKYSAPGGVLSQIEYLDRVAGQISELYDINENAARRGMALSDDTGEDWQDNYEEVLKLKKYGYA